MAFCTEIDFTFKIKPHDFNKFNKFKFTDKKFNSTFGSSIFNQTELLQKFQYSFYSFFKES